MADTDFSRSYRTLNVDMEWLYGATENSNMEVDIGYLQQVGYCALSCYGIPTFDLV